MANVKKSVKNSAEEAENVKKTSLVIIGGGPAGMAAAVSAYEHGVRDMVILERDSHLGGILNQCIHAGFGLHKFGEELTGPEYASRYAEKVISLGIPYKLGAMVTDITPEKRITYLSEEDGKVTLDADAVILAMGARERSRGALNIPGTRPAGVYTAGTAQRYVNIKSLMPGKKVVILGSGDIGLIMARRMTLEGAEVKAVCELLPYSGGLARNIAQCLDDFGIPLMLSHTVTEIHGKDRVTGVTISEVDERRNPIPGTEQYIECDTLLLSCGLLPENELSKKAGVALDRVTGGAVVNDSRETSVPGIFSCGNVLHIHDLVDFVSDEGELCGIFAAEYLENNGKTAENTGKTIKVKAGGIVRYTVPMSIADASRDVKVFFRVGENMRDAKIEAVSGDSVIYSKAKKRVAPGEMENITLTSKMLAQALENGEITVRILKPEL
ncbi:MAG: FAD-dependent oxidoreductase [Clostridia bacterium]|nr:FAD-dependent oxidoreductase [Clostridia bacterium]